MQQFIYKILTPAAADEMRAQGHLTPSGVDLADGYVHFSTAGQLVDTLDKHYAGHGDLRILAVDAAGFGAALKWVAARDGDLFPHLYGALTYDFVAKEFALTATRDGLQDFLSAAVS